jgi:hypothetical protein
LSHRFRGHTLRRVSRRVDTSVYLHPATKDGCIIESGRIDNLIVCSCGERWRHDLVDPLRDKWAWR